MCFPFSPGKRETHKQFVPHPFPGQSRKVVYVYWFFCPLSNVQASVRSNNSGQFEGRAHENVGLRGKRARKFTRTSPRRLPKGPFRTKNSTALESVVFCYRRSFSLSVPFSCLFCLEKQAFLRPLRSVLLRPYRIFSPYRNLLSVVFLGKRPPPPRQDSASGLY